MTRFFEQDSTSIKILHLCNDLVEIGRKPFLSASIHQFGHMFFTLEHIKSYLHEELVKSYEEREREQVVNWLLEHVLGLSRSELVMAGGKELEADEVDALLEGTEKLKDGWPLQYVLGEVPFHQVHLKVDKRALIPRQETEELVDLILKREQKGKIGDLKILDLGTGSGCIAIALSKGMPEAEVHASDYTTGPLSLARENADKNGVAVLFHQWDIMAETPSEIPNFDVIVSNPPYVLRSDRKTMDKRVVDHEPGKALFVKDDDPLVFYQRIMTWSQDHLNKGGRIYFEIHESKGKEVEALMKENGFTNIELHADLSTKQRMASGEKPA